MRKEQRASPRIPFDGEIIVFSDDRQLMCRAVNLSAGGMEVRPAAAGHVGSRLRLLMALPGQDLWMDLDAELVRESASRGARSWALKFCRLPMPALAALGDFVLTSLGAGPEKRATHGRRVQLRVPTRRARRAS